MKGKSPHSIKRAREFESQGSVQTIEMGDRTMNCFRKKMSNARLIPVFTILTLFLAGCGDSETAKGITDAVKKSVEGEVNKKSGEIKKQIDQVIKPGSGKGHKEEGGKDGEEKSGKDSDEESKKGKD
jgi:hypothetical protein